MPQTARATPHFQRGVEVQGLRLRYIDVGPTEADASPTPLLLVHGHTSRLEEYDAIVPVLARHHRVLVPDLPGSGYSDKPARPYTLQLYEDTLLGFLDALGIREAFVAGGSLGGNLTLRLGHRAPDRFPRLAPWAPAGAWDRIPPWLDVLAGLFRRQFFYDLFFWPTLRYQSRFWYEPSFPGRTKALEEAFAYYREVHGPSFVRMYWEIGHDQITSSLFGVARAIRQPTLIAWGDRDHGMNMGAGVKRLVALLPRARLHVFPGARHSLAAEVPDSLARLVGAFLRE